MPAARATATGCARSLLRRDRHDRGAPGPRQSHSLRELGHPDCRTSIRTRPLEALVIGAYVRGLSTRDIESLAAEAGLPQISKTAVSDVCRELRDRYRPSGQESRRCPLAEPDVRRDLPARAPGRSKEGVLVAWGYTLDGSRVLLDVCLGQRERTEDWLDMGRGHPAAVLPLRSWSCRMGRPGSSPLSGLSGPTPTGGAARSIDYAMSSPSCQRSHCLHERVRRAYWAALDGATSPQDAESRLRAIVGELERDYPSAAACLADDLPALTVHLAYPLALRKRLRSTNLLERSLEEVRRRPR